MSPAKPRISLRRWKTFVSSPATSLGTSNARLQPTGRPHIADAFTEVWTSVRGWRRRQKRGRVEMIVEGAWVLVVGVVTLAAVITVVLLTSEKLYDPNRAHK